MHFRRHTWNKSYNENAVVALIREILTTSDQQKKIREHETRLRNMSQGISDKGFTAEYNSLMGNLVFNATVFYKSSFLEKLTKPMIEALNSNDRKIGSTFMIQSLKLQISGLKIVMNRDYLKLINIMLYQKKLLQKTSVRHCLSLLLLLLLELEWLLSVRDYQKKSFHEESISRNKKKVLLNKKNLIYKPSWMQCNNPPSNNLMKRFLENWPDCSEDG